MKFSFRKIWLWPLLFFIFEYINFNRLIKHESVMISGYLYFPAPGLLLGPGPALALNLYLPVLAPDLYLTTLAPNLRLPALAPDLYLLALASNLLFISSGQHFTNTTTATCTTTTITITTTTTTDTTTSTTRDNNNKRYLCRNQKMFDEKVKFFFSKFVSVKKLAAGYFWNKFR